MTIKITDEIAKYMNDQSGPNHLRRCPVISHTHAPFDWDDVKPGMAFEESDYGLCWYIGKSALEDGCLLFEQEGDETFTSDLLHDLTRAPEHDIEVK